MMTLLVIAMVTGITVWWLLVQRLKTKPWAEHGIIAGSQDKDGLTSSAPKVGLLIFLGMVTSLFLVFIGAYFMRKDHGHGGGMHEWVAVDDPNVLWLNTLVLVLASVAMQLAHSAAGKEDLNGLRRYFTVAGVLSAVFLLGQFWAWQLLASTGLYTAQTPAYSFFALLTGAHALHLIGGLWVLGRASAKVWRGLDKSNVVAVGKVRMSVQLCTVYWHFLLLVWLVLFWLLMST